MTASTLQRAPTRTAPSRWLVRRRRLFDALSGSLQGGVTLLTAPAGSGKTTLLRSWIEDTGMGDHVAWMSVDRNNRSAHGFWLSLIGALAEAVDESAGGQEINPLPQFGGHAMVRRLMSNRRCVEHPVLLVIDDLHELQSIEAHAELEHLLGAIPPGLQIVLATRHDPRVGLHRLRLTGQLTELRASDMRFTLHEARALFDGAGIVLTEDAALMLHERTEGWAAGLRLAALSAAGHPDPQRFVAEFSGTERTVAEYLLAEVLDHLPHDVRHMLLCTSILQRVNGPLADVLIGGSGSERMLLHLENTNAFVMSLDVQRSWFRYHRLFADLLSLELRRTAPEEVASLHRVAARWFASEGHIVDAVAHAQAAGDWHEAARLLADNDISLSLDGRGATIHALLTAFPDDSPSLDAELAVIFAGAEIERGSLDRAAAHYAVAQELAATVPDDRRRRFEVALGIGTLGVASRRGDFTAALESLRSLEAVLDAPTSTADATSIDVRALALMTFGIVELWSCRFDDARRDLQASLDWARRIGRPYVEIGCLGHLAIASRSLTQSTQLSAEAIDIAERHRWESSPYVALPMAAYGLALSWAGRFAEAECRLSQAERALRPDAEPTTALILSYARGLMYAGQGRLEESLAAFHAAETMGGLIGGDHLLTSRLRSFSLQTQVRLGLTDAVRAQATARHDECASADRRAVMAAIHLAEGRPQLVVESPTPTVVDRSASFLDRVDVIQLVLLRAVAFDRLGDLVAAEAAIEVGLELAEPEGIVLPFALAPVRELVERHPRHRTARATMQSTILNVLAGFRPHEKRPPLHTDGDLSAAELRVLRHLPSNLTAPAIAAELGVSTNTVKTHMWHIYTKLGAHGRAEAVHRARELGLLGPNFRLQ